MSDLIQLLPDHIANQIAAGEVVQRPASIVKELLENAIDAGATDLQFIYRDAGKELIQVVDNGCGMSPTDARMAFERHATSKIRSSEDLFAIQTMGFRGEALASIAAVAKVELRTRRHNDELGTRIVIEDGRVLTQEACQCDVGSNLLIRHLFYNVPARRKFLKSDAVEVRHMNDEFSRIALANPDLNFKAFHGTEEIYRLPAGKLSQRITGVLGKIWRERIVPVEEDTSHLRIRGYVCKPEYTKKRSGEQFFFVNGRFIQSRYLHHAVKAAYDRLIPDDAWPMYVLFLTLDARQIDINVHPTKQEIKFEDERLVYQYLRVAVRHSLGQFSVAPMIDFDAEMDLTDAPNRGINNGVNGGQTVTQIIPSGMASADAAFARAGFDPHQQQSSAQHRQAGGIPTHRSNHSAVDGSSYSSQHRSGGQTPRAVAPGWGDVLPQGAPTTASVALPDQPPFSRANGVGAQTTTFTSDWRDQDATEGLASEAKAPYQLHQSYIIHQLKSGFVLIDQQGAHERVLYERYLQQLRQQHRQASQVQLFAETLELPGAEAAALQSLLPDLTQIGFDIDDLGDGRFVLRGLPADLDIANTPAAELITDLLSEQRDNLGVELKLRERVALGLARRGAVRRGTVLTPEAQTHLVAQLFSTSHPEHTPSGHRCILSFDLAALERDFGRG